jgi:Anti-sigma factor NepR
MVDDAKHRAKTKMAAKKIDTLKQISARPELASLIGQRLESYYNEISKQPIPERFMALLDQLETADLKKIPKQKRELD